MIDPTEIQKKAENMIEELHALADPNAQLPKELKALQQKELEKNLLELHTLVDNMNAQIQSEGKALQEKYADDGQRFQKEWDVVFARICEQAKHDWRALHLKYEAEQEAWYEAHKVKGLPPEK